MKKILFIAVIIWVILLPQISIGQTEVSGTIATNETWTVSNSPYLVVNDVAISSSATLTIEPGVQIVFSPSKSLIVRGGLSAIGNELDSIRFSAVDDNSSNRWSGINVMQDQGADVDLEYCIIKNTSTAISEQCCGTNPIIINHSKFTLNNTAISGGATNSTKTDIQNSLFINNHTAITGGIKTVNNCVFESNTYGLNDTEWVDVSNSKFLKNNTAINGRRGSIINCTITKNEIGIYSSYAGFKIEQCLIQQNDSIGLVLTDYDRFFVPHLINSAICYNSKYSVYNNSSKDYDISGNCFCTNSEDEIAQKIYDGIDDVNRGIVSFSPFETDCGIQSTLADELTMCDGEEIIIEAGNEKYEPSYIWKNLDDDTVVSDSSSLLTSTPGTYSLEISNEVESVIDTFDIINYQIPTSIFDFDNLICSGETSTIAYTGDGSTEATYNWNFDGGTVISGSGQGPYELMWTSEGLKSISLEVIENGCSSFSENQIQIKKTPTADFSVQTQLCEGESALISYTGNANDTATFTWDFGEGTIISGEGSGPFEVTWESFGTKIISLSVEEDGCSSDQEVQEINYNQYPSISFEANESTCYNEDYSITFTGSNYTDLNWSFDGANIGSGSGSGTYILNWNSSGTKFINLLASNNGCSKDSTIIIEIPVEPYIPDICLVTVDKASSKNMLVWQYDLESVSQFGVYRETNVSGEYALIEYVDEAFSNSYIDSQSSPAQQSNRYKITSLDSCGTETELSDFHKTIHLTINQGIGNTWNLIWDGYEGFSFGTYKIYRSLNNGEFELLTEIASNLTSFTDTDVSTSDVAYQIEVVSPNSCVGSESGRLLQTARSRSNIARSSTVLGTISINDQIEIFPNPTSDYLNIESSLGQFEGYELMTLSGQVIKVGELTGKDIVSLEGISSGVYFLSINTSEGRINKRIVKK